MSLFRISGKVEINGKWSEQQSDFGGYFVRDDQNIIQGYVVDHTARSNNQKHFIVGIYENANIVFVKMTPYSDRSPVCFVHLDSAKDGYWDTFFPIGGGFFANHTFQGHCSLSIFDDSDASHAKETESQIHHLFADFMESSASPTHLGLLEDVGMLRCFLDGSQTPHD